MTLRLPHLVLFAAWAASAACAGAPPTASGPGSASATSSGTASASVASHATVAPPSSAAVTPPPGGKLTVADARRYMVRLINRDRATVGLPPVELDEGAPSRSGDRHARDMAKNGFLGHWGTDGSIPEQRLTESGGVDMVMENAFCVTDEKPRELETEPRIDPAELERAEDMFFHEVPPNDGHRKNILKRFHTRVGIGIALAKALPNEGAPPPCLTHEFIDVYASYAAIPATVAPGAKLHVSGTFGAGVTPGAVGWSRLDEPQTLTVAEANRRRLITQKSADVLYWPRGYVSDVYVELSGANFSVDVAFPKPGFYELSVWAKYPGEKDFATISLRTIRVK